MFRYTKLRNSQVLFIILITGLFLRFLAGWQKVFWFDEAWTWQLARQNLAAVLSVSAADNNPPFYYLLLHFWQKLNQTELFLRIPSIFFGLISTFLIYQVGKSLFNQKIAITSSLIFALSPLHVYFSSEARMYSLWTMLILLSFYSFIKILKKNSLKYYLLFTIYYLLSLYTHYFTLFFLLTLNLFLILKRRKYPRQLFPFLIAQIISFLAFLPWLIIFLTNPHPQPWGSSLTLGIPATFLGFALGGLGMITLKAFLAAAPILFKFLFMGLFIFLAGLFGVGLLQKDKQEVKLLLFLIIFFPLLLAVLISLITPVYSPRAFVAFSFAFYLLAARGLEKLSSKIKPILFLLITLLVTVILIQNLYPPFKPQTIRMAADFIKQSSTGKPLIIHTDLLTFYPFLYYLKGDANQYIVYDSGLPKKITDILGNSPVHFYPTVTKANSFWSVTFSWDEKTRRFKKSLTALTPPITPGVFKTINDLEIFYYQNKKPNL